MFGRAGRRRDSETLAQLLERAGSLEVSEAVDVLEELAVHVSELHDSGRIHRAITADTVLFDQQGQPHLGESQRLVSFGGPQSDNLASPPELQLHRRVFLPEDLDAARKILAEAGSAVDPRRIDVYQLGAILVEMLTGFPIGQYLRSPQAARVLTSPVRAVIEAALGFQRATRFDSCDELKRALHAVREASAVAASDASIVEARLADGSEVIQESVLPPAAVPKQIPKRLGHFRIERPIGAGGMGDVYAGYDETLHRTVAIKVLPSEFARHDDLVRRFHAEASAAARLAHPNIVPIYFIGRDGPHHFFVMQLVDGESLAGRLQREIRLSPVETVKLLEDCLHGLDVAHGQGLVHRDVKPANILIDAKSGRAMLADFGLVHRVDQSTRLTATGMVMGTVDYIAPEQARGQVIDSRTDLYSLGVLAYRLLSGRLPFQADTPTAMLFQHAYETPPALRHVAPDVPERLAAIATRLMAKKPEDRYQSCERVLADLTAYRQGKPISIPAGLDAMPAADAAWPRDREYQKSPGWWRIVQDRAMSLFRAHAPALLDELQTTEQRVDSAIAEYARRRQRLVELIEAAVAARDDLAEQASRYQDAFGSAEHRVATARLEMERIKAEQDRAQRVRAAEELRERVVEQNDQIAELEIQLSQVDAKLVSLRSERDLLLARLQVARARLGIRKRQPTSAIRIAVFASLASLVVAAGLWFLLFSNAPAREGSEAIARVYEPEEAIAPAPRVVPPRNDVNPPDEPAASVEPPQYAEPEASPPRIRKERRPQTPPPPPEKLPLFVPDEELLKELESAPVVITDFEPNNGAAGDEVAIFGRGFADTMKVTFSGQRCNRDASFEVVSDAELRAIVPKSVLDGERALPIVVTARGTAIAIPPETLHLNGLEQELSIPRDSKFAAVVDAGGIFRSQYGTDVTYVVRSGGVLNEIRAPAQFLKRGGNLYGLMPQWNGVVYHEAGGESSKRDVQDYLGERGGLRMWQTPTIAACPVKSSFRYVLPATAEIGNGPPLITDFYPKVAPPRHIVTLLGRGFSKTLRVEIAKERRDRDPLPHYVVSDSELRVELPLDTSYTGVVEGLFVVVTETGATYMQTPDIVNIERLGDGEGASGRVWIVKKGAVLPAATAIVTVVEAGAHVESHYGFAFVKKGGRIPGGGTATYFEDPDVEGQVDPDDPSRVPVIQASEVPCAMKIVNRLHNIPEPAFPIADAYADGRLSGEYNFFYIGTDEAGVVSIYKTDTKIADVPVRKEANEWRFDPSDLPEPQMSSIGGGGFGGSARRVTNDFALRWDESR